ncbi:hypothetical protein [Parerythrobacter lacustris]|uniref:hypothetical protein n=1 Tax=Parerythrobacter lacustris TaxID=2969984 RepID=UPI00214C3F51|nr:hypothetical protein [Parerythrobacter lacustris]
MTGESKPQGRSQGFWIGLFCANIGAIVAWRVTDAINSPTGTVLLALTMLLLIPIVKAGERSGCNSPAMRIYNRRVLIASFGYVLGLGTAISLWRNYDLARPAIFAISMLPVLPTFGMIWAMARYLIEEEDEYLRYRTTMAALVGLGGVLAIGIFWGFLEMFELVPHIWSWWVLPVWALGLAIAQLWMKVRAE